MHLHHPFHCPSTTFSISNVSELLVKLEVTLERVECGRHGHNLLIVRGFGAPLPLHLKVIILAQGRGHEDLVGRGEGAVKIILMLAADVLLEDLAGHLSVSIEENANGVFNGGATGSQLRVVPVKFPMNLVDVVVDCFCKYP